jgi:hypothetical protein
MVDMVVMAHTVVTVDTVVMGATMATLATTDSQIQVQMSKASRARSQFSERPPNG